MKRPLPDLQSTTRILERVTFQAVEEFDLNLLGMRVDIERSFSADTLVRRLSGYLWAEKLQDEEVTMEAQYPATWWQHFKHRWFPARALKRWPVQMTTIKRRHTFKVMAVAPDFRPATGVGHRYIIHAMVDSRRSFIPFREDES